MQELTDFLRLNDAKFQVINQDRFNSLRFERILRPNSLSASKVGDFTFLSRVHKGPTRKEVDATLIFTEVEMFLKLAHGVEIRMNNPRFWFSRVANHFFPTPSYPLTSFKDALEDEKRGFTLGRDCEIHPSVYLGHNVNLGDNVKVDAGAVIHSDVRIGNGTFLGSNSVLGGVGFGFERLGNLVERFPHYGTVQIGENVSIGSNSCIDRGALSDTVIGNHVQIDNLVHVAHGAIIGESTFLVAGSLVCGSVTIGQRVWIGGNASIREGLYIGDDSMIGLGSVVIRDVREAEVIIGNPGRPLEN